MSKASKSVKLSGKPNNALEQKPEIDGNVIQFLTAVFGMLCILSTVVFNKTSEMGGVVFPIMSLLAVLVFAVYLYIGNKLNTRNIAILIMTAGFLLRLNYVLYTPLGEDIRVRQHDLFAFGGEKGHSAYIEHFYNNGFTLPDFDPTTKAQFYHPPLHHFIAATWLKLLTTFGMSYSRAVGSLMFLTLFYSTCCMLLCERIFSALKLRGKALLASLSIVAFHPTFIILAGSVNNDILSIFFVLLSVYTTIKWYSDPTTKNILYIALSIGLGMSTKLSAALVSIPIALVFLMKLISEKKKVYDNMLQYCIFGVVCLPLGLWFSIRNAIKFDVPLTYVQKLSETSDQYIGDKTVYERLFDMSYHPFENVFLNRIATGAEFFEYNPFVAIVKTSLFGEYNYGSTVESIVPACRILLILNMIIIALSLVATVYFAVKDKKHTDKTIKIFLLFYQILMFCYYIKFCFDFPHNCSMDFRYIVPTMVLGAFFIGAAYDDFTEKNKRNKGAVKAVSITVWSVVSLFCFFSAVVYIMLGS